MNKVVLFSGLIVLVSFFSFGCNRKETGQFEAKSPFMEAVERIDGGLNTVQVNGKKLYKQYCSICHGKGGKGDGFNAFNLNPRPADLTEVCKVKEDKYIIMVVTGGTKAVGKSSLCPPFGRTIQRGSIKAIITYLKTLVIEN